MQPTCRPSSRAVVSRHSRAGKTPLIDAPPPVAREAAAQKRRRTWERWCPPLALHVVVRLHHKLSLRAESWGPKFPHDILVGKVTVAVLEVPLYHVSFLLGFSFYCHLLAGTSWSTKKKNKDGNLSRNLRPKIRECVQNVRKRYLPQEFLIACLAIQLSGAEWTKSRRETGEVAQCTMVKLKI